MKTIPCYKQGGSQKCYQHRCEPNRKSSCREERLLALLKPIPPRPSTQVGIFSRESFAFQALLR